MGKIVTGDQKFDTEIRRHIEIVNNALQKRKVFRGWKIRREKKRKA